MQLNVREVARLLGVDEDRVYRWIREGSIPCHRVEQEYRFNRGQMLEWATAHGMKVAVDVLDGHEAPSLPRFADALREGGVHTGIGGSDVASVLRAAVDALSLPDTVDREVVLESLLAREAAGSTGVGDGIAIPHVRNPLVVQVMRPSVALCFLTKPIDFSAIDGGPVHTLFLIVATNARMHIHLLSRLSAALHDKAFRAAVNERASAERIFAEADRVEMSLAPGPRSDKARR